ncbi:MAG: tRNA (adenosine(37)-N6)-threonylcarbamoyltransferase complex transferase subunit TsaD [Pseudomonadota bacterium]|nr:tRNA (adenosine(37)-N6)-threonylcarbamoyltransferase complex transferase subunit TsaD [Pseudomonadota bacterium]
MLVLGIETSCDETGVAVYDSKKGLLSNELYSQIKLHQEHGGVVPELASRDHVKRLSPLLEQALKNADCSLEDLDLIAYTAGPGLKGCLLVGSTFARSLAYILEKPSTAINHIEAHLLAPLMENPNLDFPFVGLLISGGHTMLLSANELGTYNLLGTTLDDAIGEAFDKTAKLMGLEYPGGPQIERIAKNGRDHYNFPRPLSDKKNCDFSFSGLKTHIVHTWKASEQSEQVQSDIASELQRTAADCLVSRLENALSSQKSDTVIVSGGVSANSFIRQKLTEYCSSRDINIFFPSKEFCTDNGAMIAHAGYLKKQANQLCDLQGEVKARWPL